MNIALVALTARGAQTARRLALPGAVLHGRAGRVGDADLPFAETTAHLRALFTAGTPIVGLCASGVLIRALAPLLGDKRAEPPVLALAEDGGAVVPLLGGHRGANRLARWIAAQLAITPAITTASDLRLGVALDDPPPGWRLSTPEQAGAAAAQLLAGAAAQLSGDAPWLAAALPLDPAGTVKIRADIQAGTVGADLVYRPRRLALGVGCERGCPPDSLADLAQSALADAGLSPDALACIVSLDVKRDEPAVLDLADRLGVPVRFFDAMRLEAETPRLAQPSDAVFGEVGCHGVAEGAALAAAGPAGRLLVEKRKGARCTAAIAAAPAPLDPALIGRARGRLAIVGVGPGDAAWRSPEATMEIARATDLVAYGLYLDLLGPLAEDKRQHRFPLGAETERVDAALALAAEGAAVALVSSGDAGIYAMGALVFERLACAGQPDWARSEIITAPGISALQAAAARAGAPLGHDFCAISLSDLLTPWAVIESRLEAAAAGDFVVCLYNPASKRRTHQLPRARDILLSARPRDTPVVLARNLGRPGESVKTITLGALDPARVDMLTVVVVGGRETRALPRGDGGTWVYTPRGYAVKETE